MDDKLPGHALSEYLREVVEVAKRDGKITPDEYDIIRQLSFDTAEYTMALEEAERDGVIDDQEKTQLLGLKDKLLENAKEIANADGIVSNDELALITKLREILKK